MNEKVYHVYILANQNHTVFYTGVTSRIMVRMQQHKKRLIKGFTSKYNCDKLVYYERFSEIDLAIRREKQLKKYKRVMKFALIQKLNPAWNDLSSCLII